MGKQFDELAKALASGTSRRVALRRLASGLAGAALANVFLGRGAEVQAAGPSSLCLDLCGELSGVEYRQCLGACTACENSGGHFTSVNHGPPFCVGFPG
jgi:hypothetical protein